MRSQRLHPPRTDRPRLPPIALLAFWQVRQTWFLLLVTGVSITIAVMLAYVVPLYSDVATTAGLRSVLTTPPTNADVMIHASVPALSISDNGAIQNEIASFLSPQFAHYLSGSPQFSIQSQSFLLFSPHLTAFQLFGIEIRSATSHMKLVQGRLPNATSNDLEIVMTQSAAQRLGVRVGSTLTTQIIFSLPKIGSDENANRPSLDISLRMHLVGLFTPVLNTDSFWHGNDFQPATTFYNGNPSLTYSALLPNKSLLALCERIVTEFKQHKIDTQDVYSTVLHDLYWYYHIDTAHLSIHQLDDLMAQLHTLQVSVANQYSSFAPPDPYIDTLQLSGPTLSQLAPTDPPTPDILRQYQTRVTAVRLPVTVLLLLIIGLLLFATSTMIEVLIERQGATIALLRSRGASSHQIFGVFTIQCVAVSLVTLFVGPLLALVVTHLLASALLSPTNSGAQNVLSGPFATIVQQIRISLLVVLASLVALCLAIWHALRLDVLTLRRESARTTSAQRPLWQKLRLDLVAAIIALTGYGVSLYISQVTNTQLLDARLQALIAEPLSLIAPIFLVIAGILFFLRFFPLLLRTSASLATRRRSAVPLLTLAQMSRAPRAVMRTTLLLALATAFAFFALVFSASQTQHIPAVVAYSTEADLSGTLEDANSTQTIQSLTSTYRAFPGVSSATFGSITNASTTQTDTPLPLHLRAVDATTFAQTAIWSPTTTSLSLPSLMQLLIEKRGNIHTIQAVPAIVDTLTLQSLHLTVGSHFTINVNTGLTTAVPCVVVAVVDHLPTVNDSTRYTSTADDTLSGGLLVDYQSYATVYEQVSGSAPLINYVWLRTTQNANGLAHLRSQLAMQHVSLLFDRQAMTAALYNDPLYLALIGILTLGAITALFLTLLASLIVGGLSVYQQSTHFALLRALGTATRQLASLLAWEQGMVYAISLLLGILFGLFLSLVTVPVLVFSSIPMNGTATSNGQFYALQRLLPMQIVFPPSLLLALCILIGVYLLALGMLERFVRSLSMGQTLRLNED